MSKRNPTWNFLIYDTSGSHMFYMKKSWDLSQESEYEESPNKRITQNKSTLLPDFEILCSLFPSEWVGKLTAHKTEFHMSCNGLIPIITTYGGLTVINSYIAVTSPMNVTEKMGEYAVLHVGLALISLMLPLSKYSSKIKWREMMATINVHEKYDRFLNAVKWPMRHVAKVPKGLVKHKTGSFC